MARDTLHFVHSDRPPATDDVRVFESLTRPFLGTDFTFRIVGSSHYVSAPAYDFYELSSCDVAGSNDADPSAVDECDSSGREGVELRLEPNRLARRLPFESDAVRCVTRVEHRPLSAFPRDRLRTADLAYAFDGDPEAATTIDVGATGYETYHTYPEYDLALYTRTAFTAVREDTLESPASVTSNATSDGSRSR